MDSILNVPDCASCLNRFMLNHALHKSMKINMFQAQYAMLIDIVHNAVLYTEPKKKVSGSKLT